MPAAQKIRPPRKNPRSAPVLADKFILGYFAQIQINFFLRSKNLLHFFPQELFSPCPQNKILRLVQSDSCFRVIRDQPIKKWGNEIDRASLCMDEAVLAVDLMTLCQFHIPSFDCRQFHLRPAFSYHQWQSAAEALDS